MSRPRGVSLLEMMVGIAILAVMGTGLLLSTAGGRSRASTQALADRMAEVFKQARETAIAQQKPVAVIIPATSAMPLADSYYVADGRQQGVVRKAVHLAREMPGTYLFAGHWNVDPPGNSAPTPLAGANHGLDLASWDLPIANHAAYVYSPSGTLVSNRVEFAGAYHLVVCQGAEWTSETVDGVSSARLESANSPVTLRLSKSGTVQVVPQVEGQSGVQVEGAGAFTGPTIPAPPPPPASSNQRPVLTEARIYPKPQPNTLPPGVKATVAIDGYLTLEIEASDPEGDLLDVVWTASPVPPTSGSSGSFSSPVRTQASYQNRVYRATWEWRPPPTSVPGNRYELSLKIRDSAGNEAADTESAVHRVETIAPGTILFVDDRTGNRELYTMNNDGSNERRLTRTAADEAWPQLSPDGTRILYCREQAGTQVLMTVGIDGLNPRRILRPADLPPHPPTMAAVDSIVGSCWSPDGARIAVIARYGGEAGGLDVYVCDADGSHPTRVNRDEGLSVTGAVKVTWHFDFPYDPDDPTNSRLLFTSPYDDRYFAFFPDRDPDPPDPPNPPDPDDELAFNGREVTDINAGPNGKVAWVENGDLHVGRFVENPSGGLISEAVVSGDLSGVAAPAWSPTGDMLVFNGDGRLYRVEPSGSNLLALTAAGALEASWGP